MKRCCKRAQKFMNRHAAKTLCARQDRPAIGATSTPSPSTQTRLNSRSPKPLNRLLDSTPPCDNWLDSFRLQLKLNPTPLNILVNEAIETNRAEMAVKQIELSVDLPPTLCVLDVDPTRFIQVISNLLHNSTKFTEPGGSIRVVAHINASGEGNLMELNLSVIDTGIGISAELLPHVFTMSTQGERGSFRPGLGIGLALARRLVEMRGGQIDKRSDGPGTGSEFIIRLPLSAADMQPLSAQHDTV